MTPLETIASVLALVPNLEAKLESGTEGVCGTLYSECGKQARFYIPHAAGRDAVATHIGEAFLRLADLRLAGLTQKGTS